MAFSSQFFITWSRGLSPRITTSSTFPVTCASAAPTAFATCGNIISICHISWINYIVFIWILCMISHWVSLHRLPIIRGVLSWDLYRSCTESYIMIWKFHDPSMGFGSLHPIILCPCNYRQTSNISCTLVGNKLLIIPMWLEHRLSELL